MAWSTFRDITYLAEGGGVEHAISDFTPAIAVDRNRNFHMVFSDLTDNGHLRHLMRGRTDRQWREVWGLTRQKMHGLPSIAFVGDTLHVVSVTPYNRSLWHASKRGDRLFSDVARIHGAYTKVAASIAGVDDTLYMVHHDQFSHGKVWHTTFRGHWSSHQWVNRLTSRMTPVITSAANRLQIWTTDARHGLRFSSLDPRFEQHYQPLTRIQHPTRVPDQPVIHGAARANTIMIATAVGPLPFAVQTNQMKQYMFSRAKDDGSATARVRIPQAQFSSPPCLATSGSSTLMVGRGFNRVLREATNTRSEIAKVGLAFKVHDQIAEDFKRPVSKIREHTRDLIRGLNRLYKPYGLSFFERTAPELLDLPASFLEINAGRCLLSSHSDEQRALFSNRNGMQRKDIGIYVVERIRKVDGTMLGGCGSPKMNACMVVPWCNAELLGHEIGHALGLRHARNQENLMTPDMPSGTTRLVPAQVETAMRSDSVSV